MPMKRNRFAHGWQNISIRTQLLCCMALVLCFIVIVFLWTIRSISATLIEETNQHVSELVALEAKNLTEKFEQIEQVVRANGLDQEIQTLLSSEDPTESYALSQRVQERLAYLHSQNEGVLAYAFTGPVMDYSTRSGLPLVKALQESTAQRTDIVHSGPALYQSFYPDDCGTTYPAIVFGSHIRQHSQTTQQLEYAGFSAVIYRTDSLLISSGETQGTQFYLLDENGVICAQSGDGSLVGQVLDDSLIAEDDIVRRSTLENVNMTLTSVTSADALLGELDRVRDRFLLLFGASALIVLVMFLIFIRHISQPIVHLGHFIARLRFAQPDVFKSRISLEGSREIRVVANQFNRMFEQIDQLTQSLSETGNRLYAAELERERAELYSLRSQINPHFLYNTLECAKGIARQENAPQLTEILDNMSRIFRYSVKGAGMVRLEEELNVSRAYLAIQQTRFPDRFEAVYEIDESAKAALIPKMTLQPLIENAILHGIAPTTEKCFLRISAKTDRLGGLTLQVSDDGAGMSDEALAALRALLNTPAEDEEDRHSSIGLRNIIHRIRLIYGEAYGISVDSMPGEGTRVIVHLPLREEVRK